MSNLWKNSDPANPLAEEARKEMVCLSGLKAFDIQTFYR